MAYPRVMERGEELSRTDRVADRLARLGRRQWLLVAVPVALIVVASILMGQRVVHTGDAYRAAQEEKQQLSELRNDMWEIFAEYWRGYAVDGRPQIPPELAARYLTTSVGLSAIMTNRRNAPGEGALITRVETVLNDLTATVTSDTSGLRRGSPEERAFRGEAEQDVTELEDATTDWFRVIDRSIERQERHSDTMISRAFTLLGLLVATIVGIVFGLWLLIDRARRTAITRMTEERDATRLVMASVQDGLAVVDENGTVSDVNDRMSILLGRTRDAMIGRPAPWGAFVPPDFVGETELAGTSLAPGRVLFLSASPMAGSRGSVHVVRDITERTRREEEMRNAAAEQESLRRIATFVAGDAEPARVFEMVAREIALMVDADAGVVTRFDEANQRSIDAGVWMRSDPPRVEPPARLPLDGLSPVAVVHRTGAPARVDEVATIDPTSAATFADHGIRCAAAAPVLVGSVRWGAVAVYAAEPGRLAAGTEDRLARFAEIVELTVASADTRARLATQATIDSLTGLANRQAFHERLEAEIVAAGEGGELSLVVVDLDRFKDVNEDFGHQVGDEVLADAARRLAGEARSGELVAHIGAGQFAWIMPGTDGINAWRAAERARQGIASRPFPGGVGTVTASAGIADLTHAADAATLFGYASSALLGAKANGRNVTLRYSQELVRELSAAERDGRLAKRQAVAALRALARAVDAKDPSTARHAERVASLAVRIAHRLGWSPSRLALIEEAALLHDVGKIGVPDALLFKSDRLAPAEMREVEAHATLGAEIVSDVLSPEQVRWVRGHHERWDGEGYPDRLSGADLSDGAAIIAVADAWDAMTSIRVYGTPRPAAAAVAEIRRCSGLQFSPDVVGAIDALWTEDRLAVTTSIPRPGFGEPDPEPAPHEPVSEPPGPPPRAEGSG